MQLDDLLQQIHSEPDFNRVFMQISPAEHISAEQLGSPERVFTMARKGHAFKHTSRVFDAKAWPLEFHQQLNDTIKGHPSLKLAETKEDEIAKWP